MSELDLNAPITEWELDEWSADARADLTAALIEAGVAHKWEGEILLAAASAENEVEEILDDLENDDNEIDERDEGGESADSKVLGQLSSLAQRISRNPSDTNSLQTLGRILEEIEGASAPGDLSDSVWRQIKDLANQINDTLGAGEQTDESTAMDLAGRLFAILRSHI